MAERQRGFWSALFGSAPTHERFSVQEMQHLHGVLLRNPVVSDSNRETVVEALRSLAELVIWGDQHDPVMVEYFLTENLLAHFTRILQQRANRRGGVAQQVLQTLSILIQNLRTQQTVYYLFSNNHINEVVSMRFDFDDDEVLGYYVNLLKAISLKLNEATVQFFFQAAAPPPPGGSPRAASFPLYTESIKFVNHRDPMVRAAVKTLTLNVYAIPLPAVQQFVASRPAAAYFSQLAAYIAEQCQALDRLLSAWEVGSPAALGAVEAALAEVEDLLSYCNDVLGTGVEGLRTLLLDCLWQAFVGPVLFWPLVQDDVAAQHIAALTLAGDGGAQQGPHAAAAASAAGRAAPAGAAGAARAVQRGSVGPLCSLYVFERLFRAVTDQHVLAVLVSALLGGGAAAAGRSGSPGGSRPGSPREPQASAKWQLPVAVLARLQYSPAVYRQTVLAMLRDQDAQVAAAVVRVLAALLQSRAASEEQLELIGLLPLRRRKQRQLLQALVGDSPLGSQLLEPAPPPPPAAAVHAQLQAQQQAQADRLPACSGGSAESRVRLSLGISLDDEVTVRLRHNEPPPQQQQQHEAAQQQQRQEEGQQSGQLGAAPAPASRQAHAPAEQHAEQQFGEVADALLGLLAGDLLPPLSLATLGWLLNQLLSVGKGGAQLTPAQRAMLDAAVARRRGALRQQLQGLWPDALVALVAWEWGRCRQTILRSGPGPVHLAVQTWMQAVLVQELRWQQGSAARGGAAGAPDSAAFSAKQAYLVAAEAVAALQLHAALSEGDVPPAPPCPAPSEAAVRAGEVREGVQIALASSQRMHCSVCFKRGEERAAYFAVEGLPSTVKAGAMPDLAVAKPTVVQQVAAAAPVCLVADPGSQAETGLVLSVAPLMGAEPQLDPRHPRWLHVEVRPPLRGLLKVLQASHPGNVLLNLQKHLLSGHWVLSFPDGDRAASAKQHVEEWAHRMRAVYCQLLHPLLDSPARSGSAAGRQPSRAAAVQEAPP